MAKSKNLDRYATYAIYSGEPVSVTVEQFELLEATGCCKLSAILKEKICKRLYFFTVNKDSERLASTKKEQQKILIDLQKILESLNDFFQMASPDNLDRIEDKIIRPKGWHAHFRVKHRIEDAIEFPVNREGDVVWGDDYELLKLHADSQHPRFTQKENTIRPVDLNQFEIEVRWLQLAAKRAIKIIEIENSVKKAEQLDSDLDALLIDLDDIYKQATGKKNKKMPFFYTAISFLPDSVRPKYPKKPPYYTDTPSDPLYERLKSARRRIKKQ